MANSPEIKIRITGDTSSVNKTLDKVNTNLNKVEASGKQLSKSLSSSVSRMSNSFKDFNSKVEKSLGITSKMKAGIAGLAAGFSVVGIKSLVNDVVKLGDDLGKTADAAGVSTDFLQKFRFVTERTGVATSVADASLGRFVRRIGLATTGVGAAAKTYKMLGISLKDNEGNIKSQEVIFNEVAQAVDNLSNSTQKTAAISQIFGRFGLRLVNTMKGGSDAINVLTKEFESVGGAIEEKFIRQAELASDKMTNLDFATNKVKTELVLAFSDQIINGMQRMVDSMVSLNEFMSRNQEAIDGVGESMSTLFSLIESLIGITVRLKKVFDFLLFFPKTGIDFVHDMGLEVLKWAGGVEEVKKETEALLTKTSELKTETKVTTETANQGYSSLTENINETTNVADDLLEKYKSLNEELDFEKTTEGWTEEAKAVKKTEQELVEVINKYAEIPGLVESVTSALNKQHAASERANAELARSSNISVDESIAGSSSAGAFERISAEERVRDASISIAKEKRDNIIEAGADEVNAARAFELQKQDIIKQSAERINEIYKENQRESIAISGEIGFGAGPLAAAEELGNRMSDVANSASRFADELERAEAASGGLSTKAKAMKFGKALTTDAASSLALARNLRFAGRGTIGPTRSLDSFSMGPAFGVQSIVPESFQEESKRIALQEVITNTPQGTSKEQLDEWKQELLDRFGIGAGASKAASSIDNSVKTTNVFNVATNNPGDFKLSQKQLMEEANRQTNETIRRNRRGGISSGSR